MNAPRHLVPLLLFLALAGAAAAQSPVVPGPAPVAPAAAPAPAPGDPAAKDAGKAPAAAAGAKSASAPPLSPRFLQVRSRIDALFRHRNEAPPAIDPKANPFRGSFGVVAPGTTGATTAGGGVSAPPPPPVNPELQLLQQAAAALKVAGVIQINGRDHLIINQAPYKEGDVIIARAKGQPVYLRLKAISRFTFTLTYNDSELAVKY